MRNEEADYLTWLVKKMNVVPNKNYGMLLRELYRWEFYSIVPRDEDRGSDGIALRGVWANEIGYDENIDFGPPRVLETFIGIALRIEDKIFGGPWMDEWDYKRIFWDLINNLGLIEYDGVLNSDDYDRVGGVLDAFLSKKGNCDTFPNIFVFQDPPITLRKLNIWSQIGVYIGEKWPGNTYL
jgi:hypothetical protein